MALQVVVTPGVVLADNTPITYAILRALARPTVTLDGAVDAASIPALGVTNDKIANATIDLDVKAVPGSCTTQILDDGAVTPAKTSPGAYFYAAGVFAAGVYSIAPTPAPSALAAGQRYYFKADTLNTGATDVTVALASGSATASLFKEKGIELAAGDIKADQLVEIQYDGTNFQMLSAVGNPPQIYAVDSGAANAYVIAAGALNNPPAAYVEGYTLRFKAANQNTGASTININSLGTKTIKKSYNVDLVAGDIKAGQIVELVYDAAGNFQMVSPASTTAAQHDKYVRFNAQSEVGTTATAVTTTNTFTVNTTTDVCTSGSAHGMATGQVVTLKTSNTLPGGLDHVTPYFARVASSTTFTLHPTLADANANTNIVNITTTGTGTHLFYWVALTRQSGVSYVIRTPGAAATNAPLDGDFTIAWETAFSDGNYLVFGTIKGINTGNYPQTLAVHGSDTNAAGTKRILCAITAGPQAVNPAEASVLAIGT